MRLRHVRQPPESKLCSHAVLATAARVDLGTVIQVAGHEPQTPREIREAAVQLNLRPGRLLDGEFLEEVPAAGVWVVTIAKRDKHAVVVAGGRVYDPGWPEPLSRKTYTWIMRRQRVRVVCFFEVQPPRRAH